MRKIKQYKKKWKDLANKRVGLYTGPVTCNMSWKKTMAKSVFDSVTELGRIPLLNSVLV